MPLYEFQCVACEKPFEELVRSGTPSVPCPACGSEDVRRRMSKVAFVSGGKMKTTAASSCAGCSSGHCGSCGCGHKH